MDCTQIRNRLSDPFAYHAPDVAAHIRACADCRAYYEAESLLRSGLTAERSRVPASDYGTAGAWIARVITNERTSRMPSILATPARRWGLSFVVAALAFFTLIPLPYESTIGTQLTITSPDIAMTRIDVDALKARLTARGMSDVTIARASEPGSHSLTYHVRGPQKDAQAAFEATRDMIPAVAAIGEIALTPWTVRESGTLLAQMTGASFSYNASTSGRSDAEIAQDIRSQLESQGLQIQNLSVNRDDTSATFDLSFTPPDGEGQAVIKQVIAGNDVAGKPMEGQLFMPKVDKSLPVEEQIAEIKRQLAANGITDVEVTVDPNGGIRVEAKKDVERH